MNEKYIGEFRDFEEYEEYLLQSAIDRQKEKEDEKGSRDM